MNGKAFSHMIGTLNVFTNEAPIKSTVTVIDFSHVHTMSVSTLNGEPVFGGDFDKSTLDLKSVSKVNIPNEVFQISADEKGVHITNLNHQITFKRIDSYQSIPKLPKLDVKPVDFFDAKRLLKLISSVVTDRVIITSEGTNLKATVKSDTVEYMAVIGTVDPSKHPKLRVIYSTHELKKVLPKVNGVVTCSTEIDTPIRMVWDDGNYRYEYLLAPMIIKD